MTRSRYDLEEALNRILRTLEGKALTADTPDIITGDVLNKEDALSDLSELLDNSLPGETLTFPTAIINALVANLPAATTATAGVAELADVDEANAGESQDTILTPEGHTWAHEYGGMYATGTRTQSFAQDTWTKVTGTFQGEMTNSGEVDGDWNDDRIIINESGSYFVPYQLDLFCHGDAVDVHSRMYVDAVAANSSYAITTLAASGTVSRIAGFGILSVTGSGQIFDLRLSFAAANDVTYRGAKISAIKMVG